LEDVLEYNEKRLRQHVRIPFFQILEDGTLLDEKKRARFLGCLYVWSGYFQQIMFSRQATSVDERFKPVFLEHLAEELGHDKLLEEYGKKVKIEDPVLEATSSWFVHKMFQLDNVGKAALVHLVLEASGDEFHTRADPLFSRFVTTEYFNVHAELDDGHAEIGVDLLKHQHPVTYAEILNLIEQSWDMFETLMDRIVYLVNHQDN
jgi:hypothetical protein